MITGMTHLLPRDGTDVLMPGPAIVLGCVSEAKLQTKLDLPLRGTSRCAEDAAKGR